MLSPAVTKGSLASLHALHEVAALGGVAGVADKLGSSLLSGLPHARTAANRESFGENRLPLKKVRPFWSHLIEAFEDTTLQILVGSAAVSMLFGIFLSDNSADFIQGLAIVAAVVIVSGVNSFQNWSKDREFTALAALKEDFRVTVKRDGALQAVSVYDLVVGDVVKLVPGERLPCDGLLIEGFDVQINQSSMTGESRLVAKDADLDPFIIGGCIVQQGDGSFLVTAVGLASKMGQTVSLVEDEEPTQTPLQERLTQLAEDIGKFGTAAGTLTFAVLTLLWFLQPGPRDYTDLVRFFIVGVTIVVVAVPEGLPLAVTISLAFSMRRMMKDNNLVRQLQACETMGSATVIASDKTGTLTENRMSVVQAWAFGLHVGEDRIAELPAVINDPGAAQRLAKAIVLNSTAGLALTESRVEFVGNPTEGALLLALWKDFGVDYSEERSLAAASILARRPFDKGAKFMSSLYAAPRRAGVPSATAASAPVCTSTDAAILYVKGAPEVVLGRCASTQTAGGELHAITAEVRFNLEEQVAAMARRGLRTLAVAYRRVTPALLAEATTGALTGSETLADAGTRGRYAKLLSAAPVAAAAAGVEGEAGEEAGEEGPCEGPTLADAAVGLESQLVLLGLFGIADPLREGVTEALQQCMRAGIRVLMVTGDHRDTAAHIARQCGILQPGLLVMEGAEFRALDEPARAEAASRLAVLARSSPTDKYLLVKTLKAGGEVVAVTGDGTNDAPALRVADVGLAMGIAGTEVAKEASDIVILDDRFASIVASVRWGRSIKENIRKFLTFQLTINVVALTLTFVTACTNGGSTDKFPITPVQLLFVNLIMDTFAALALATEPPSENLMAHPPQGKEERLITRTMTKNILGHALFQTALLLVLTMTDAGSGFFGVAERGSVMHHTAIFTTFVALQVFNLFNCRSVHDEWNILEDFSASVIGQAIVATIVVMQVVIVQFGGSLTQTEPLSTTQWALCVAVGFTSIPVGYILKLVPACDHELRKLGPGHSRGPHGLFFAETDKVRGKLVRSLTSTAETAAAGGTAVDTLAQQSYGVVASVLSKEAHAGGVDDDSGVVDATGAAAAATLRRASRRTIVGDRRASLGAGSDSGSVDSARDGSGPTRGLDALVAGGEVDAAIDGDAAGHAAGLRRRAAGTDAT